MKQPAKIDIAVLMLFFNRSESFEKVFKEVKKAKPTRLFLYQDGPRNKNDMPGILACREIVKDENIDWECQVERHYCEKNQGCDPSGYLSHKWAFSMADKCIILEDDVVPSQSFFPFCKEMLDKYENDNRITMVCGFNEDEISPNIREDYFFTSVFAIWGWASWKRVIDQWDDSYSFLQDQQMVHQLETLIKERHFRADFMKMCQDHAHSGKPYFESIFWSTMLLNHGLAIMPTKNLITNIGATTDSTHYSALQTMPKALRFIFSMKQFELDFPLRHPKYIIENIDYKHSLYRRNGWGHPGLKIARSLEELVLNLKYGNFSFIRKSIGKRICKWLGKSRHT